MDIKNRVSELKTVTPSELQDNKGNWRLHPKFQRDALAGVLGEVGIADALKAYYSKRNKGKLTLVDGHLRKEDYPGVEWPVLILDISDEEADILLATLDPIAAMAETNHQKYVELQATLTAQSNELKAHLQASQAEAELELSLQGEIAGNLEGGTLRKLGDKKKQIKPVLYVDDLAVFEEAIRTTGNINRGEAVIEICKFYLEKHAKKR